MSLTNTALKRVVTFANGKGGVGKTSTACNFAGLCAAAGWRTLLLDFDPQGNAGHDLGYAWEGRSDEGAHMLSVLDDGVPMQPVIVDSRPGLDAIPMGRDAMLMIEDFIAGKQRRGSDHRTLLARALAPLASRYDLIVVDTPPTRPVVLSMVLGATRWVVVPTKADRSSIMGLSELGVELSNVRQVNPHVSILGAALFDTDTQATRIRREAAEDIAAALDGVAPVFNATIRHSAAAIEARALGKLAHELAQLGDDAEPWYVALREGRAPARIPSSAGALADDYLNLTNEILTRIATAEGEAA